MAKAKKGYDDSFTNMLLKAADNELASLAEEETLSQTTEYISTGSLALNGLLSSDIFKGIPNNKIVGLCGEEATGKTFIALQACREAQAKGYIVVYFDSENAVEKDTFVKMGVDTKKVLYLPVDTLENFRDQAVRIVNKYNETEEKDKPKLFFVLDSLGGLSSKKEINDIETGNDKADMTKGKIAKSIFRVLGMKLAKAKIPMIITSHVYDAQSFIPAKILAGGCLTEETKIKMADGTLASIKDVKKGDFVVTMFGDKEVLDTFHYHKKVIEFEFSDGYVLKCTESHKFLTEFGGELRWTEAKKLNVDDEIIIL